LKLDLIERNLRDIILSALINGIETNWDNVDLVDIAIKALYRAAEYT
jgi:hypothetical protein